MFKWILSILLTFSAVISIYILGNSLTEVSLKQNKLKGYIAKERQLQSYNKNRQKLANEIQNWNLLWEKVNDSKLKPEHWLKYPLDIKRNMSWSEVKKTLNNISSNSEDRKLRQWFRPEQFEISYNPEQKTNQKFDFQVSGTYYLYYPGFEN